MEKIIKRLFEMQDIKYKEFSSKLIPNIDKNRIIGVRTPDIRNYAKELQGDQDKYIFLSELPHKYMEENNLHAELVNNISKNIDEVLRYIDEFLPYIDNWATCDMFAPKIFKKYPDKVYEKIKTWINSNDVYVVRFAVVTLIGFYLDDNFKLEILDMLECINTDEYYINMAIAWFYSFALIKQYESTIKLFENKTLDKWIHNKSIQKAIESRRISDDKKAYLKKLKIKG